MNLNSLIRRKIEGLKNSSINKIESVSGGCISNAFKVTFENKETYFLKINDHSNGDMFIKEAHGLLELSKAGAIKIPEVIDYNQDYILLEFIYSGSRQRNFFGDFGRQLAELHKVKSEQFGFYEDNYIGSSPQLNINDEENRNNWIKFYFNKRLLYQYRLAEKNGFADYSFKTAFKKLENKIESVLDVPDAVPSLLHGDLWSGNFIPDMQGNVCLIDPAVYYGHRETDLAMTKLFGGFPPPFYESYNESFPLPEGWQYREKIYMLYHVLNHLNLFGSGYYSHALSLMQYYL
jgi:fructosamine-3-kinase